MQKNIGTIDSLLRIVIGVVLIALAVLQQLNIYASIGYWGYLGIIPLVTGLIRMCPLYCILGFKTCGCGSCPTDSSKSE